MSQTEHVVVLSTTELEKQSIYPTDKLQTINIDTLDQYSYGFLPRHLIDNKSAESVAVGKLYTQVLPYNLLIDSNTGRVLVYQRKGKEEGLLGKWSLGIGGHLSLEDMSEDFSSTVNLSALITNGANREFVEETGLIVDILAEDYTRCILSYRDKTSQVHLGLVSFIEVDDLSELELDPSEFNNIAWLSIPELKQASLEWEAWSDIIVKSLTNEF